MNIAPFAVHHHPPVLPARARLPAAIVLGLAASLAVTANAAALQAGGTGDTDFSWEGDGSDPALEQDDAADLADDATGSAGFSTGAQARLVAAAAAQTGAPEAPPRAFALALDDLAASVAYDALQQTYRGPTQRKTFAALALEGGAQLGDWSLHARQLHVDDDGRRQTSRLGGYLQRRLPGGDSVVQAGQVAVANPVLAGAWMDGVQWASNAALGGWGGQAARVEGVAHSPRARVEVRQSGQLLHVAMVPGGPFVLDDIPGVRRGADLSVKVIEEDGSERQFNVAHALAEPLTQARGVALAAGQVHLPPQADGRSVAQGSPWVVSAGWAGQIAPDSTASLGAVLGDQYQALGASLTDAPWSGALYQLSLQHSRTTGAHARRGHQWGVAYSEQLYDAWSVHATYGRRSAGYRDLLDHYAPSAMGQAYRSQWGLASQWAVADAGVLSLGYQRGRLFDGRRGERGVVTWSRPVGRATLSLSGQWGHGHASGGQREGAVQASITVPLGRAQAVQVAAYHRDDAQGGRVQFDGAQGTLLQYRAGLQARSGHGRGTGGAVGVSILPLYAQLDVDLTWPAPGLATRQLALRGGWVVANKAVLPRSHTPADLAGNGAGPLQPLGRAPARGRPLLLQLENMAQVPAGTPIVDAQGAPVAVVQGNQQALLRAVPGQTYWVGLPDGERCALEFDVAQGQDEDAFFQRAAARCQAPAVTGHMQALQRPAGTILIPSMSPH